VPEVELYVVVLITYQSGIASKHYT